MIICYRESNLFHREFMLSCAKISLLMFLWRIFSKAIRGSGRISLLRFYGISSGSLKIGSSRRDLLPELQKNLIDLPRDECYAQIMSNLLVKQSNSFPFVKKYYLCNVNEWPWYLTSCLTTFKFTCHYMQYYVVRVKFSLFWLHLTI